MYCINLIWQNRSQFYEKKKVLIIYNFTTCFHNLKQILYINPALLKIHKVGRQTLFIVLDEKYLDRHIFVFNITLFSLW